VHHANFTGVLTPERQTMRPRCRRRKR